MNKKIIALISGLIIILSSVFIFSFSMNTSQDDSNGESEEYTTDDIMDEIDGSLLDDDDEVEIGEIV